MCWVRINNRADSTGKISPVSNVDPTNKSEGHDLIDVWNAEKVRTRGPILIAHRGGVDGFQIDCVYQDYFGRPKTQKTLLIR